MSSKYSVEVRDQYGRLVTVIQRPMNKQFSVYRNRPGSCQFTLDLFDSQADPSILKLNQYDIVFRRGGTPVFAGQISYIHPHIDQDNKTVDIIATGYLDLLDQRYITQDFPNYNFGYSGVPFNTIDSGQVMSTLIDNTQFPLSADGTVTLSNAASAFNGFSYYQSFLCPGIGTVSQLRLLLTNVSASGNITIALYPDNNGLPDATSVTNSSITVAASTVSAGPAWYNFTYTTPPSLTKGTTYWIRLLTDTTQTGSNGIRWSYLNNNYYLNGKAYTDNRISPFSSDQDLQFFILLSDSSYQMTKNTYFGMNAGTITTSFNISPTYTLYKRIKSCIEDISKNFNGIDFNFTVVIDPVTNIMKRYYNVFYPRQGINNIALNFSYPGNIKKIGKPKDGKSMANEIVVRGQGFGTVQAIQTVADPASIQAYGLRQVDRQEADVPDTATLFTLGKEQLRMSKDPLDLPTIYLDGNQPPHIGDFGVGDQIFITVTQSPILDFIQTYRIEQMTAIINEEDAEEIELVLSLV